MVNLMSGGPRLMGIKALDWPAGQYLAGTHSLPAACRLSFAHLDLPPERARKRMK
jgi:hypothetical protein